MLYCPARSAAQRLEPVARRGSQEGERRGAVELLQLAFRDGPDVGEPGHRASGEQGLRVGASE
jgi:hypothetical protein